MVGPRTTPPGSRQNPASPIKEAKVSTRDQLEEIANRRDPEEWLRVLLHESTRANNAEDLVALHKEALRAATEAFAHYALNTNEPAEDAVDGFVEGFIQEANTRILARRRRSG